MHNSIFMRNCIKIYCNYCLGELYLIHHRKKGTDERMDLKAFRENKLKIKTQSEFATLIGVDQSSVSRWEKDPTSITYAFIQKIMDKTGCSFEELTDYKRPFPDGLDVCDTWTPVQTQVNGLVEYLTEAYQELGLPEQLRKDYVDGLLSGIKAKLRKPKVAIIGRSDTGKSTLINALLGTERLPTSWTPTTSIAVYVMDRAGKPPFIEEDVWVFRGGTGSEPVWDVSRLQDEAYCREWKLAAGGVEMLNSFGTRQGENYEKKASAAVLFLDAPILKDCSIIDLPGFGTETENDDVITFTTAQAADVIIYLSQATGFMRIEDISFLKGNIFALPVVEKLGKNSMSPLANLFVLASQAHNVNSGARDQLETILNVGCWNLTKTLPDTYWNVRAAKSGYEYPDRGFDALRARFFAYTTDIEEIYTPFNTTLKATLETLPLLILEDIRSFVSDYVQNRSAKLKAEIEKMDGVCAARDKYYEILVEIQKNEPTRKEGDYKRKQNVRHVIKDYSLKSVDEFREFYESLISVDRLVEEMRAQRVQGRKIELELFVSALQSEIQWHCEQLLQHYTGEIEAVAQDYSAAFNESVKAPFEKCKMDMGFDATWCIYSAFLNFFSRWDDFIDGIDAPIFFKKSASFIGASAASGVGFSLMGLLFPPLGVSIGAALLAAITATRFAGVSWETSAAKKIVKAFEKADVVSKYNSVISEYWSKIATAFDVSAKKVDADWEQYLQNLSTLIQSCDQSSIREQSEEHRSLLVFLGQCPQKLSPQLSI